MKKNQELEVKVLKFDVHARRIALGHKQMNPDPWGGFEQQYAVGAESSAEISQIIEKASLSFCQVMLMASCRQPIFCRVA